MRKGAASLLSRGPEIAKKSATDGRLKLESTARKIRDRKGSRRKKDFDRL